VDTALEVGGTLAKLIFIFFALLAIGYLIVQHLADSEPYDTRCPHCGTCVPARLFAYGYCPECGGDVDINE
jgi:rRNA maturation endonuclease Nob1